MFKKIFVWGLVALVVLVGVFAGVVAMQPAEYRVERSAVMAASPEEVFAQVNDFHNWAAWSPWAKLDPDAKNTFEGPDSGEGAIFRWAGNSEVGEGSMTILESRPPEFIRLNLEFIKPFEDTATTEFTFKPEGAHEDQTHVTWTMFGKHNFISKAFCMFMDMDQMVGGSFEEGLASMKAIVEAEPDAREQSDPDTETLSAPPTAEPQPVEPQAESAQ